jgi:hypothetical protein
MRKIFSFLPTFQVTVQIFLNIIIVQKIIHVRVLPKLKCIVQKVLQHFPDSLLFLNGTNVKMEIAFEASNL